MATFPFLAAWGCLLGALPLAAMAFAVTRRCAMRWRRRIFVGSALFVLATTVCATLSLTFTSLAANSVVLACAYIGYCYVAVSAWTIRSKLGRLLALIPALVPVAAGYVMGTVGFLGLAFVVNDFVAPPLKVEALSDNMHCVIRGWGMVASDSGYTVHVYSRWPWLPFVERETAAVVVNETAGAENATCQSVLHGRTVASGRLVGVAAQPFAAADGFAAR